MKPHTSSTPRLIHLIFMALFALLPACSPPTPRTGPAPLGTDYPPPTPDLAAIPTTYPPEPIEVTSEEGQFHVAFPCCGLARGSILQYASPRDLAGLQVICHVLIQPEDGASWLVEYCELPPDLQSEMSQEEILDWWRDEVLGSAKVPQENAVENSIIGEFEASLPGRALTGRANMRGLLADGTLKARIFLAPSRVYQVAARVYDANWGNRLAMIDPFLGSFYIYTALTIPFEPTPTP